MDYGGKRVIVTGSAGLVGSEAVAFYSELGARVLGIDNNMRRSFFGADGDTTWNRERLEREHAGYEHCDVDIRDRTAIDTLFRAERPTVIVHCAAQPSHDLAAKRPFDDFDVNAVGTLNLLEACRQHCPESPFVFTSTNKVYGDAPNEIPLVEQPTRWDYARPEDFHGIDESCRIDNCLHSLFGASKVAADVLAQEYGRYFGMPVGVFRGGCLTGSHHSGAELHGFLAYLVRATFEGRKYRIFGHKGKQVRDNIHSRDVVAAMDAFARAPRPGAVYNLGGGRDNSISMLEAIRAIEQRCGRKLDAEYVDEARIGDHICYITDMSKFRADYPSWSLRHSLDSVLDEMVEVMSRRYAAEGDAQSAASRSAATATASVRLSPETPSSAGTNASGKRSSNSNGPAAIGGAESSIET
ncbi:MAG: NAD-dependent epimerase/dehydratase family protein [Planctomycetes bacterium]|nr:NAD-dependent epimerase/dehydratase family protein [Planctomycetota bacterium]